MFPEIGCIYVRPNLAPTNVSERGKTVKEERNWMWPIAVGAVSPIVRS